MEVTNLILTVVYAACARAIIARARAPYHESPNERSHHARGKRPAVLPGVTPGVALQHLSILVLGLYYVNYFLCPFGEAFKASYLKYYFKYNLCNPPG